MGFIFPLDQKEDRATFFAARPARPARQFSSEELKLIEDKIKKEAEQKELEKFEKFKKEIIHYNDSAQDICKKLKKVPDINIKHNFDDAKEKDAMIKKYLMAKEQLLHLIDMGADDFSQIKEFLGNPIFHTADGLKTSIQSVAYRLFKTSCDLIFNQIKLWSFCEFALKKDLTIESVKWLKTVQNEFIYGQIYKLNLKKVLNEVNKIFTFIGIDNFLDIIHIEKYFDFALKRETRKEISFCLDYYTHLSNLIDVINKCYFVFEGNMRTILKLYEEYDLIFKNQESNISFYGLFNVKNGFNYQGEKSLVDIAIEQYKKSSGGKKEKYLDLICFFAAHGDCPLLISDDFDWPLLKIFSRVMATPTHFSCNLLINLFSYCEQTESTLSSGLSRLFINTDIKDKRRKDVCKILNVFTELKHPDKLDCELMFLIKTIKPNIETGIFGRSNFSSMFDILLTHVETGRIICNVQDVKQNVLIENQMHILDKELTFVNDDEEKPSDGRPLFAAKK